MELEAVDPDIRDALSKLPRTDPSNPFLRLVSRVAIPLMPAARVAGVTVRRVREGGARARLYTPQERSGAGLLWVHGGGFVLGAAKIDDQVCAETARELGVVVASVDYRLAPAHPFPAPLDDAAAAWSWFQAHAATLGVDPARIAIGGQSAGGGLAASLAQRLRDTDGTQPAAQWLLCPMLDDRTAARTELDAIDHWVWSNRSNRYGWHAYLGQEPGMAETPEYAVPARRADLAGLPPAWLDYGSIELFRDEIIDYADRLRTAGVPVVAEEVPGAPHGFETWAADTPPAQRIMATGRRWLSERLGITD